MVSSVNIHILAGGASQRMGSDKKQLLLHGVTMLDWCRLTAESLDIPVHVIKEDQREGHGPLAGIETGMLKVPVDGHLFLSCDMPFVSSQTLLDLVTVGLEQKKIICMEVDKKRGFPLFVPNFYLPFINDQLNTGKRSLYALFHDHNSIVFTWAPHDLKESLNVNTQDDFQLAKRFIQLENMMPPVTFRHFELVKLPVEENTDSRW